MISLFIGSSKLDSTQIDSNNIDAALYQLLISSVAEKGLWDERNQEVTVRVDPKIMIPSVTALSELEYHIMTDEAILKNKEIIKNSSVQPGNIEDDKSCMNISGILPPPESVETKINDGISEKCKFLGNFVSIIFSSPEPYERFTVEKADQENFVINAIEISSYTYGIFKLIVEKQEDEWILVDKNIEQLVMS